MRKFDIVHKGGYPVPVVPKEEADAARKAGLLKARQARGTAKCPGQVFYEASVPAGGPWSSLPEKVRAKWINFERRVRLPKDAKGKKA